MILILILIIVLILILCYCLTFNNKSNEFFMTVNNNLENDELYVDEEDILINPYQDISKTLFIFSFKESNLNKDEFLNKFMIYYTNDEYLNFKKDIENLNIKLNNSIDKRVYKVYTELVLKIIKLINVQDINQEFDSLPNKYLEIIKEIFKKDNINLSEDNIVTIYDILFNLVNKIKFKIITILNLFNIINNDEETLENKETFMNINEINNQNNYLNNFYNRQPFIFNK